MERWVESNKKKKNDGIYQHGIATMPRMQCYLGFEGQKEGMKQPVFAARVISP